MTKNELLKLWIDGAALELEHLPNLWTDLDSFTGYWVLTSSTNLRLKPKKKQYRVALLTADGSKHDTLVANNAAEETVYQSSANFVRWLTEWTEYT